MAETALLSASTPAAIGEDLIGQNLTVLAVTEFNPCQHVLRMRRQVNLARQWVSCSTPGNLKIGLLVAKYLLILWKTVSLYAKNSRR